MSLKQRILLIAALTVLAIFALVPRNVKTQSRGKDGILRDSITRHVPLREGLDLKGGMYLALEPDQSKKKLASDSVADAVKRAVETVRNRVNGMGVSETSVQTVGNNRIVVEIPGETDPARARSLVEQQAFLQFVITDKTDALNRNVGKLDQAVRDAGVLAVAATTPGAAATPAGDQPKGLDLLLNQHKDSAAKADSGKTKVAAAKGGKKDSASKARDSIAAADSAAKALPNGAFSSAFSVASNMPGEYIVPQDKVAQIESYLELPTVKAAMPPGKTILPGRDSVVRNGQTYKYFYMVDANPIMTGEALIDARPNTSPTEGTLVEFTLTNAAGRRFRIETGRHVNDYMAIVLDNLVMGRPPVIQGAIGNRGQITMGGQDIEQAQDLSLVLRAGALPVPLKVAEETVVGPILGKDAIHKGVTAGAIAIVIIVLIMMGYYRFSGILAVGGLVLYVLYTLAMLAGFDAVLTLPGMAGFILSIGIAVDANVLIFERTREELDRGKTPRTAIEEGFRHAMPAIIDSNVSTVLTAAVLYQYGTGPVKGFAVTLIAGIVASLLTSIFVVKTFYLIWLSRTDGAAQTLSI